MVKNKKTEPDIDTKFIIYAIVGIVFVYIIYTNFWTLLIGGSITLIVLLIILIVGYYYLLPILGINLLDKLKGNKQ